MTKIEGFINMLDNLVTSISQRYSIDYIDSYPKLEEINSIFEFDYTKKKQKKPISKKPTGQDVTKPPSENGIGK